jgi:hypothetical protein
MRLNFLSVCLSGGFFWLFVSEFLRCRTLATNKSTSGQFMGGQASLGGHVLDKFALIDLASFTEVGLLDRPR